MLSTGKSLQQGRRSDIALTLTLRLVRNYPIMTFLAYTIAILSSILDTMHNKQICKQSVKIRWSNHDVPISQNTYMLCKGSWRVTYRSIFQAKRQYVQHQHLLLLKQSTGVTSLTYESWTVPLCDAKLHIAVWWWTSAAGKSRNLLPPIFELGDKSLILSSILGTLKFVLSESFKINAQPCNIHTNKEVCLPVNNTIRL